MSRFTPMVNFSIRRGCDTIKKMVRNKASEILGNTVKFLRKCLFRVLAVGPVPQHIAFIMDGNRRYARKWNLLEGAGHKCGFWALMSTLKYCYELGVKYVTVYALSIDNLKRKPNEVKYVMDLMEEKIEWLLKEGITVNQFGIRVYFVGDLNLLSKSLRAAAERLMESTAGNSDMALAICVGYTSTNEIAHSVSECCRETWDGFHGNGNSGGGNSEETEFISLVDVEKYMHMAVMSDPNILVRTSGETRLSNFLLWQSSFCHLYAPSALWPEIRLWHLVWATINFQRNLHYLEKRKRLAQLSEVKKDI